MTNAYRDNRENMRKVHKKYTACVWYCFCVFSCFLFLCRYQTCL